MKIANPQGKAALPLLAALQQARPGEVFEKPARDILRDFCLSALVLGADFRFKPVPGKVYYLYYQAPRWKLSLIAPHEWTRDDGRDYVARCHLQPDTTWQVDPDPEGMEAPQVKAALSAHIEGFNNRVTEAGSVEAALPFYIPSLPYYQRVLASGLAVSLGQSILCLGTQERALLGHGTDLAETLAG